MPRLIHKVTGVVVNVDDATASGLDSNWAADTAKPSPAKSAPKKSEN